MSQIDMQLYNAAMEKLAALGGLQASYVADAAGADASERANTLAGDKAREDEDSGLIDDIFGQGADAGRMINKRKRHGAAAFAENKPARMLNLIDPSQLLTDSPDATLTGLAMVSGKKDKDREARVLEQYKDIIKKYQDPVEMDGDKTTRETPWHLGMQGLQADADMDVAGHKQQRKEHPLNYWLNPVDRTGPVNELIDRWQRRMGAAVAEPDSAMGRFGMGAGNVATLGLLGALAGDKDAQNKLRRSAVANKIYGEESMPKGADKPKDGDGDGKVNDGTSNEKEAGYWSEIGGSMLNPLNLYGGNLLGGAAALATPTKSQKEIADRETDDESTWLKNLIIPGVGPYHYYKRLGNSIRGPEIKEQRRKSRAAKDGDGDGKVNDGTSEEKEAMSYEKSAKGRCWDGYEPVPGKKAYSDGSCQPAGSKKKKKKSEKAAASCSSHSKPKKKSKKVEKAALEIATKVAAYRRIQEKQAREVRIKLASHVLRIHHLRQELETYDPYRLSKSAAIGAHKADRLKAAALVRQIELEKQAFLGSLVGAGIGGLGRAAGGLLAGGAKQALKSGIKGLGQGARAGFGVDKAIGKTGFNAAMGLAKGGFRGAASAANMARSGIGGAAKGMVQGARGGGGLAGAARGAIGGGARGVAQGVKADPLAGTALLGGGAMAAGAGLQNAMSQPMQQGRTMLAQGQQAMQQAPQQAMQAMQQAPQAAGNYLSNLGNAFLGRGMTGAGAAGAAPGAGMTGAGAAGAAPGARLAGAGAAGVAPGAGIAG